MDLQFIHQSMVIFHIIAKKYFIHNKKIYWMKYQVKLVHIKLKNILIKIVNV